MANNEKVFLFHKVIAKTILHETIPYKRKRNHLKLQLFN